MELVIVAITSWVVMLVGWVMSLGHLSDRITRGQMLMNGWRMFNPDNFTSRGLFWRKVFIVGFAGFIVGVAGAGVFFRH